MNTQSSYATSTLLRTKALVTPLPGRVIPYPPLTFSPHKVEAHTKRDCGEPAVRGLTEAAIRAQEPGLLEA
jgi:hypothetical protein